MKGGGGELDMIGKIVNNLNKWGIYVCGSEKGCFDGFSIKCNGAFDGFFRSGGQFIMCIIYVLFVTSFGLVFF